MSGGVVLLALGLAAALPVAAARAEDGAEPVAAGAAAANTGGEGTGDGTPGPFEPPGPFERGVRVTVNEGRALFLEEGPLRVSGVTNAPPGSEVLIRIGEGFYATAVGPRGRFEVEWPVALADGTYPLEVTVTRPDGTVGREHQMVLVQCGGELPRRPLVTPPVEVELADEPATEDFQETPDRWRIVAPPYEIHTAGRPWDPYHQNRLKGDLPVKPGSQLFLVLTATSDSLIDLFSVPTPAGVSTDRPGSLEFFGRDVQLLLNQNVALSADLFKGDTAFKPFDWRFKATLVGNANHLDVRENAVVKPDVRRGTERTDGRGSIQELFAEVKLADLSPSYDFLSLRVGVQPFNSDFRGFIFNDMNLGARLFGNFDSNRTQYNLAVFERLEKDTNSGLNTFELRDARLLVANVYRQDFLVKGYTVALSYHFSRDEESFQFDRNGFLARPDPFGAATPHEIETHYFGWTSFGHVGRLNVDSALYLVTGDDSLNPLAGREVDVEAGMAALELSIDHNWWRPKVGFFYATGDDDPTDGDGEGFDAIFDAPSFAGGGFSFWNRLGIRLPATGVALVSRGSLLPSLKSSREEGQPNHVNPGLLLVTAGVDAELTPTLKGVATANYLRFDATEPLELALFQAPIDAEIGLDLSLGVRWRPFMSENIVIVGGIAGLLPGQGFEDIYEESSGLFAGFANFILTF